MNKYLKSAMKKYILSCILLITCIFFVPDIAFADCKYNNGNIGNELESCLGSSKLVQPGDALIESGVKQKFLSWTNALG